MTNPTPEADLLKAAMKHFGVADYAELQAALASRPAVVGEEPVKYDDVLMPFLALMRKELHANSGKGDRPGWLSMPRATAMLEIYYHVAKLQKAVRDDDHDGVREYAADVANMSMMVLDVCGALPAPQPVPVPRGQEAGGTGAEPVGWLYDWTQSSALGHPDEHYTSFTTDKAYADRHDNPRAVYLAAPLPSAEQAGAVVAGEPSDAMVDAYLTTQRQVVEEADRFGRPNAGGLHTNTVREATRAGLKAAITLASAPSDAWRDVVAALAGAASAYRTYAKRHKDHGAALTDAFFSTRVRDMDAAVERARAFVVATTHAGGAAQQGADGWRLIKLATSEERSWPEDYAHENGQYFNTCCHCQRQFMGHKRRVACKVCA